MQAVRTALWKGAVGTLIAFVLAEALLRVAYFARNSAVDYAPEIYGYDVGPAPPWFDGLRILETDPSLIWKSRPRIQRKYLDMFSPAQSDEDRIALLRRFRPSLPPAWKDNPIHDISLNSDGFRDREFPRTKRPSAFRILCLGDSWTFGASAGQGQAYPQRLQLQLQQQFPTGDFEVFNLGVLGYSSSQGLQLLKQRGHALEPDFIVLGFVINDATVGGWRDKDMSDMARRDPDRKEVPAPVRRWLVETVEQRLTGWGRYIESYKLLRYWALIAKWRPRSMNERFTEHLKQSGGRVGAGGAEARVSLHDYERNIREMIDSGRRRGAGSVLLYNDFEREDPYRALLERISRTGTALFVDSARLLTAARNRIEEQLETRLNLRPAATRRDRFGDAVEVVFRAYLGTRHVPRAVYIVGNHPELGNGVPNRIAMYDDGTHGDQRAGDEVWSYSARFRPGTTLAYVYTNSGAPGRWEGLDVPDIRSVTVGARDDGDAVYLPIESFGRIYMKGDPWHTDASGYDLIASAIVDALRRDERFQRYLSQRSVEGNR